MQIEDREPLIFWENPHGNILEVSVRLRKQYLRCLAEIIYQQLKMRGQASIKAKGKDPTLIVVVLPEG